MASEFEKKRLENIERNKQLLRDLNLTTLASEFGAEQPKKPKKRVKDDPNYSKIGKPDPNAPLRRSRRIAGVKMEHPAMIEEDDRELERKMRAAEKSAAMEQRINDDFQLSDVIKDPDSLAKLGKSFSAGDFYDDLKDLKPVSKSVQQVRDDLAQLELYDNFPPNKVQMTMERMTTIEFHPSNKRKIIVAGDKVGSLGIWTPADDTDAEPAITKLALHSKNIPRIRFRDNEEIITCSYDGTIRSLDMHKGVSKTVMDFNDQWGNPSGISDIHFVSKDVGYFTTLDGEGARFDLRDPETLKRTAQVWRLHDKKIGYSTVCPNDPNLLATGSLDRTMRIWDLRMVRPQSWSTFEDTISPTCVASYRSRLSVSSVDWNASGDVVINGYDDTIRLFNFGKDQSGLPKQVKQENEEEDEIDEIPDNLTPNETITHNCQSGRWVTIIKARWQSNPQDSVEKFVIGNMKKALDVYTSDGTLLLHLSPEIMTAVPSACVFHPTENWIVGGNSTGKTFLFTK